MYTRWFDEFACDLPLRGIIYITTGVDTSAERIQKRARNGESGIPKDYLSSLERQHEKWVGGTNLPVCRISTDATVPAEQNVKTIVEFINKHFLPETTVAAAAAAAAAAADVCTTATPFHSAASAPSEGGCEDEDSMKRLYPAVTPAASSSTLSIAAL